MNNTNRSKQTRHLAPAPWTNPARAAGHIARMINWTLSLGFLLGVDMRLPQLPFFSATDASSKFRFGACVSVALVSTRVYLVRRSGREHVTTTGDEPKSLSRSLGIPRVLHLPLPFCGCFSVRCIGRYHTNLLEMHGLSCRVKWTFHLRARVRACGSWSCGTRMWWLQHSLMAFLLLGGHRTSQAWGLLVHCRRSATPYHILITFA